MKKFNSFNELVEACEESVRGLKIRGELDEVKGMLVNQYPNNIMFLYELMQNAEDAGASEITFSLSDDRLIITHNGDSFTLDDVNNITGIALTCKGNDPTKIGKFGVGFTSVYKYTNSPIIHSGEFHFRIEDMLIPREISGCSSESAKTEIILPFTSKTISVEQTKSEVEDALRKLNEESILFLTYIKKITIYFPDESFVKIDVDDNDRFTYRKTINKSVSDNSDRETQQWFVFKEDDKSPSREMVSIAYKRKKNENKEYVFDDECYGKVYAFFPIINERYHLRFHVNAPFDTNSSRDSITESRKNSELIKRIGKLIIGSMNKLKSNDALDNSILSILPNSNDFFSKYDQFASLKATVSTELNNNKLIRDDNNEYVPINELCQVSGQIAAMFSTNEIKELFGKTYVKQAKNDSFEARLYNDNGVEAITAQKLFNALIDNVKAANKIFENKSTEWFHSFYSKILKEKYCLNNKDKVKSLLCLPCDDGKLHCASETVFIRSDYNPRFISSPFYIKDDFIEYKVLTDLFDIHPIGENDDFSDKIGCDVDSIISLFEEYKTLFNTKKEDAIKHIINEWKETVMFQCHRAGSKIIESLPAEKICLSDDIAFFYESPYILLSEKYYEKLTESDISLFDKMFIDLGGIYLPEVILQTIKNNPNKEKINFSGKTTGKGYTIDFDYSVPKVDELARLKSKGKSLVVWNLLRSEKIMDTIISYFISNKKYPPTEYDYESMRAIYRSNRETKAQPVDSCLIHTLKTEKWIPGKDGNFYAPYEITPDNLPEEFVFEETCAIKAIFPEKYSGVKAINILQKNGVDMYECDRKFLSLPKEQRERIIKLFEDSISNNIE